jgi:DNA-binding IclR family transcriptional regulator
MVESTIVNTAYERGVILRRMIRRELLRRELARLPAPSAVALAALLEVPRSTVQYHVGTMVRRGWVTTAGGRTGGVFLTDLGREVTPTD